MSTLAKLWDHIVKQIKKDAKALKRVWYSVLLIIVATILLTGAIITGFTSVIIASKNANIETLQQRLNGKDDVIASLRERQGLMPGEKSKYTAMRNKELKSEVADFVAHLREFVRQKKIELQALIPSGIFDPVETTNILVLRTSTNEAEKAKIQLEMDRHWVSKRNEESRKRQLFHINMCAQFEEKFRVDAQLLRDELITRIPKSIRDPRLESVKFDYRISSDYALEQIANTLEKSARMLPDADIPSPVMSPSK